MNRLLLRVLPPFVMLLLAISIASGVFTSRQVKERNTPMIGALLPGFTLPKLGDKPGELFIPALWQGRTAVINIFASNCRPCQQEQPVLMTLGKTRGINLLGVAWKDTAENVNAYLKQWGDPYRAVGIDALAQTTLLFGIQGLPETYVLDKRGRVRWKHEGPMTEDVINNQLIPLVRQLNRE